MRLERARTTTIPNESIFTFCWNSRLRSSVTNTSHMSCARRSSSPFLIPAHPWLCTFDASCPTSNFAKSAGNFSSSSIRICRNSFVCRVEYCYSKFALYRWKLVQKLINALTPFQVIEKRADWNTRTDKHQTTAEDVRVSVGDIGKRYHNRSPVGFAPMLPYTLNVRKSAAL